jgi:hypothetical protein
LRNGLLANLPENDPKGHLVQDSGQVQGRWASIRSLSLEVSLLFLHGAGWARDYVMGERRIEYTDGSAEVIVLDRTNTADWNTGDGRFPGEEDNLLL